MSLFPGGTLYLQLSRFRELWRRLAQAIYLYSTPCPPYIPAPRLLWRARVLSCRCTAGECRVGAYGGLAKQTGHSEWLY